MRECLREHVCACVYVGLQGCVSLYVPCCALMQTSHEGLPFSAVWYQRIGCTLTDCSVTPLYVASGFNGIDVCALLLAHKADVNGSTNAAC